MTTSRYLSRFEKDLAPIQIEPQRGDAGFFQQQPHVLSLQHLEDCLEDCLHEEEEDDDDDDDDNNVPSVHYPIRADASFLACRRLSKPRAGTTVTTAAIHTATITGFLEQAATCPDNNNNNNVNDDVKVSISTFQAARPKVNDDESSKAGSENTRPGAFRDWKRIDLQDVGATTAAAAAAAKSLSIEWVDLCEFTSKNSNWLPTLGSTVHFLRSLLDTNHAASPWTNNNDDDDDDDDDDELSSCNRDCVLLLVTDLSERFLEVRVSDVCPSWYVHSICRMNLPALIRQGRLPWLQQQQQSTCAATMSLFAQQSAATLLVYRRLAPRDRLSVHHPITGQPATTGCLWESFTILAPEQPVVDDDCGHQQPPAVAAAAASQHEQNVCRMVAPPYISGPDDYAGLLQPLFHSENLKRMRQEAISVSHWTAWPESQHYRVTASSNKQDGSGGAPWNVFPLCHCFPANTVANRQFIPATCNFVPFTVALLKDLLGDTLRTALLSRLDPQSVLEAHTGWQDLANHVYRVHIPLTLPAGDLCGTWVDGCVQTHTPNAALCFDDSKTHRAFNYSNQERIVLILDLARPVGLPCGTATGGHSDELDKFIEKMGISS